jgi:hypothetical protein
VTARRIVRVSSSTLHRELQGEGVLLQLDTGEYFGLDPVGERIWSLIAEHGDLDTVLSHLLEEFDVDADTIRRDLDALVTELIDHRLIETDQAPPGGLKPAGYTS